MASTVLLYFLALAATATFAQTPVPAVGPVPWTNLYVKWSMLGYAGYLTGFGFYKMPLTRDEASENDWEQADSTDLVTIWCYKEDPRLCMMYDGQGNFCGMQISLPEEDYVFLPGDSVEMHPLLFKNNMYDTELYSARYYVKDQATLAAGGLPLSEEVGTGLWLQSGSDLIEVPRDGDQLSADTWRRQNCISGMGRHYYNLTEDMSCSDFQPFFLILNNEYNLLHGVGFQMIGKASSKLWGKTWFEYIPLVGVDETITTGPDCLREVAEEYGIISLHMYFIDRPWAISC